MGGYVTSPVSMGPGATYSGPGPGGGYQGAAVTTGAGATYTPPDAPGMVDAGYELLPASPSLPLAPTGTVAVISGFWNQYYPYILGAGALYLLLLSGKKRRAK